MYILSETWASQGHTTEKQWLHKLAVKMGQDLNPEIKRKETLAGHYLPVQKTRLLAPKLKPTSV